MELEAERVPVMELGQAAREDQGGILTSIRGGTMITMSLELPDEELIQQGEVASMRVPDHDGSDPRHAPTGGTPLLLPHRQPPRGSQ